MLQARIYQPGRNVHPKLLAIFPLGFGLALAGQGANGHEYIAVGGIVLLIAGVWTFFGGSERYIDLIERKVITHKKWLWFRWGQKIPLAHYTHVAVTIASSGTSGRSRLGFAVNLVGKDARSNHSGNLSSNMYLDSFFGKSAYENALAKAGEVADQVGVDVEIDVPEQWQNQKQTVELNNDQ